MSGLKVDQSVDVELVRRAMAKDVSAFNKLLRVYQEEVVRVARRFLDNTHDAQEAAQEAFLRAFRSLPDLREPEQFRGWLLTIARNQAMNYRRGRARRATGNLDEAQLADGNPRRASTGEELLMHPKDGESELPPEAITEISAALRELKDRYRDIATLCLMEKLPYKEVAEMLDMTVENVKWHAFQVRSKLKERLGPLMARLGWKQSDDAE